MEKVEERFLRYVKIDTQSDENSSTIPSTSKQLDLAKTLFKELNELGLEEVEMDEKGYVMGTLPANIKGIPTIGFIAHMDTSPDFSGENVNPQIINNYQGGDILLNREKGIKIETDSFPEIENYIGQDLITTDGTTLLGADDKAGIAEILAALEYFTSNPEVPHGTIRVGFTPDEEIGRGADHFDVKKFNAEFAYTLDGGEIGELEYENFNAALATLSIQGRNVHPGTAKDKMINSIHLANEFNDLLPKKERPEHTEKYEGFFHLIDLNGTIEQTNFRYIVRDHDRTLFEKKKELLKNTRDKIQEKYPQSKVKLEIKDQYFNMKEKIEPVKYIVDIAEEAMRMAGVKPIIKPIRGGTDGARLSYMGLPTPNLFTGGHNYHGRYEFIPVPSMHKAVEVIKNIIQLVAANKNKKN